MIAVSQDTKTLHLRVGQEAETAKRIQEVNLARTKQSNVER